MPGDIVFIVGGVLPFLWITWLGSGTASRSTTHEVPTETLFVEEEPVGAARGATGRRLQDAGTRGGPTA